LIAREDGQWIRTCCVSCEELPFQKLTSKEEERREAKRGEVEGDSLSPSPTEQMDLFKGVKCIGTEKN